MQFNVSFQKKMFNTTPQKIETYMVEYILEIAKIFYWVLNGITIPE